MSYAVLAKNCPGANKQPQETDQFVVTDLDIWNRRGIYPIKEVPMFDGQNPATWWIYVDLM